MEQVARNRGLEPSACMVSSPTQPIGSWLYVYGQNTGALRYCQVVDTSAPRDRARHLRTRRYVELSHEGALIFCGTTRGPVRECPVVVLVV